MSSLSIDEKMMLVQKMRARSEQLMPSEIHRKEAGVRYKDASGAGNLDSDEKGGSFRFLKIRILICVVAFSGFFCLYKMNVPIKGHQVAEITSVLENDLLPDSVQESLTTVSEHIVKIIKEKNL